jgi:hypothetical protein
MLLLAFSILIAVSVATAMQLPAPVAFPQLFPSSSNVARYSQANKEFFSIQKFPIHSSVVWGVDAASSAATTKVGIGIQPPDENSPTATVVFDTQTALGSVDAQSQLVLLCDRLLGFSNLQRGDLSCPLQALRQMRQSQGESFPVPPAELEAAATAAGVLAVNWEEGLFFENGRLVSVAIRFKSVLDTDMSVDQVLLQWNLLREFLDIHGTGSEVGTPFQYNPMTDTADTLNSICSNGLKSMIMSLLLSFLVLIVSSASYKLAVMAFISIVCTTATSMSMMVWLGWSFGVMEAICVTILVGLVVDYVVHIGHSYCECPLNSLEGKDPAAERLVRVTYALEHTGISVAGGALTTIASSVVLMNGKITFFSKFGIFMASTSFLSFIFSIMFFPALLCEFGPIMRAPPRTCTAALFVWVFRRMGYQLTEDSALEQPSDVKSTNRAPLATQRGSLATFAACIIVLLSGLAAAVLHCSTGPAGLAFCPVKVAKEELVDREIRCAHVAKANSVCDTSALSVLRITYSLVYLCDEVCTSCQLRTAAQVSSVPSTWPVNNV